MNWLLFHVASGQSFFSGIVLILVSIWCDSAKPFLIRRLSGPLFVLGGLAVTISSTPAPLWCCAIVLVATINWLARKRWDKNSSRAAAAAVASWLLAAGVELPYQFYPSLTELSERTLSVIGDSITAGTGEPEHELWPALLAERNNLAVQNLSVAGCNTAEALEICRARPVVSQIVLIEIGGNDLLGSIAAEKFELDLDAMLGELKSPARQLVMFELPLPPFRNSFGHIQRKLAARHGVALIPKRVLLAVLTSEGSTTDTIHLSDKGKKEMAETVWGLLGPYYPAEQEKLATEPPAAN